MNEKKTRNLKVYGQSGYHYKETPTIILKGQWLERAGFNIGDEIVITVTEGKALIENKIDGKP